MSAPADITMVDYFSTVLLRDHDFVCDGAYLPLGLDRIATPRKDSPFQFPLRRMTSARKEAGALLEAVSAGGLTLKGDAQVTWLVNSFRRMLEVTKLEARLAAQNGPSNGISLLKYSRPPCSQKRAKVAKFYHARSKTIPPLPRQTFAVPFSTLKPKHVETHTTVWTQLVRVDRVQNS